MRPAILSACFGNQLTIIHGATGCGKTTQIPQFVLQHLRELKVKGGIFCCQVRASRGRAHVLCGRGGSGGLPPTALDSARFCCR
jgi:hypothetical protein